jgi:hypothetical protein
MTSPPESPAFAPVGYETWRARVLRELGADGESRLEHIALEGISVEALYSRDHLAAGAPLPRLAPPAGAWRIWQEVPATAGAAARTARSNGSAGSTDS